MSLPKQTSQAAAKNRIGIFSLLPVCMPCLAVHLIAAELEEYPEIVPAPPLVLKDPGGNPNGTAMRQVIDDPLKNSAGAGS